MKGFVLLAAVAWGGAAIVFYLQREPAYFEQGIKQLHTSKYIKDRIEYFDSYSYYPSKLLKNPKSPATFQVEIPNDSLHLYLTCEMAKSRDMWYLIKIKEDNVRIKH